MGSGSDVLRQVAVHIISRDTCNQRNWYNGRVLDKMMCAGSTAGGVDSCQVRIFCICMVTPDIITDNPSQCPNLMTSNIIKLYWPSIMQ